MNDVMIETRMTDGGEALLFLAGEVDLSHVETLEATATGALDETPSRLVVDLEKVSFVDSSVLGALLRIQRAAERRGTQFSLRQPAPLVRRVLRPTRLDERLPVEP